MRELMWVLIGLLFVYMLYQLNRARVLRAESSYYDGFEQDCEAPLEGTLEGSVWRQELEALRDQVAQQHDAILNLSLSVEDLRGQLESMTAGYGSPSGYDEAPMADARGPGVAAIAERWGLSGSEFGSERAKVERAGGEDAERG